ncbi:uncharacterized protein BKA55DRAFT_741373 [Fusarium redolens]|uniref:2EXR domain-containing protein n=1 Tax=Fusarium redolens TaxID=48865 RepID=A0A9P9GM26_FUSRE|nr:uncharacterized protein BKA55DRAFT_741373 [Fusarium redolens]KAH7240367.1 hypothetical protein BKA55DRAFT_741373 [Fusarium redolens]
MASAFHLFSALPTELRLQVWKDAIRPSRPGVQILRLRVPGSDDPVRPQDTIHFPRYPSYRGLSRPNCCVAIPLWNKYLDGIDGGNDINISTYPIDAGLWTACHESRLMMQKHFLQDPWHYPSWTGYYISGGAPLYITVRYNDDLVILQLDSLELKKWNDGTLGRLQDLHDIGIEYRPEWGIDLYEEDEGGVEAPAFDKIWELGEYLHCGTRVWLIDHNLKRKVDAPLSDDKRNKEFWTTRNVSFYGADRKFSSTGLEKVGERLTHWEYINPVADGDYRKSSLYFADQLQELYKELGEWTDAPGLELGLLGWDRL